MNYADLNTNEIEVLKAISTASEGNGGDFTYFDEVAPLLPSLSQQQVKGYFSQLRQKGYILVSDDKFAQICASDKVDVLTDYTF